MQGAGFRHGWPALISEVQAAGWLARLSGDGPGARQPAPLHPAG